MRLHTRLRTDVVVGASPTGGTNFFDAFVAQRRGIQLKIGTVQVQVLSKVFLLLP